MVVLNVIKIVENWELSMINENIFTGLDLSFTSSGMSVKNGKNITVETIKTKPESFQNDLARMVHIRDIIMNKMPENVSMVCVEDFFSGVHPGSGARLAMLAAVVRTAMYEKGIRFFTVAPTSLKKYIMGKGVSQKDLIVREVYKAYSVDVKNDDEADAVVLCHMAEHIHQALGGELDAGIPKYQAEVVKNLIANADERGFNL